MAVLGFKNTIPLIASATFIFGVLYVSITLQEFHDIVWSPQQQPLLAATTLSNNNNDASPCWERDPPVWPPSLIITQLRIPDKDSKVGPATTVTYYDYNQGGNLIQITPAENSETVLWDLELNTGHSYYFRPLEQSCKPVDFPVGILRPNWLNGATPLGPSWSTWRRARGKTDEDKNSEDRLVCGWTKLDFIDYYADAETGEPDSWYFHTMKATFRVLDYQVVSSNNTIDPLLFVPPDYCFP